MANEGSLGPDDRIPNGVEGAVLKVEECDTDATKTGNGRRNGRGTNA